MKNMYVCTHGKVGRCWDCAQAYIDELRAQIATGETITNLQRFQQAGGDSETDPLERLRLFLSLALNSRDWIDVEPFLDALHVAQPVAVPEEIDMWCFLRDVLKRGASIESQFSQQGYETFISEIEAAARKEEGRLCALLAASAQSSKTQENKQ